LSTPPGEKERKIGITATAKSREKENGGLLKERR